MEKTKKITLDEVLYKKYGSKNEVNYSSQCIIETRFAKMFPYIKLPFSLLVSWIPGVKKKHMKKELAKILIRNKIVGEMDLAMELMEEILVRKFKSKSGDYNFEQYPQKDGTILYRLTFYWDNY